MNINKPEHLKLISVIPYQNFKEKIAITKENFGEGHIEVCEKNQIVIITKTIRRM